MDDTDVRVTCFLCQSVRHRSFYLCSKFHILCHCCCRVVRNSLMSCKACDSNVCLCLMPNENQSEIFEDLISRNYEEFGPVILFDDFLFTCPLIVEKPTCKSSKSSSPGSYRLLSCVNCKKSVSQSRIKEHLHHEHSNLFICPLPPRGTVSFLISYEDVDLFEMKTLHFFSATHLSDDKPVENFFTLMATKVPYMMKPPYGKPIYVILVWLCSLSHACHVYYTIEAFNGIDEFPMNSFTGQPMDTNLLDNITNGTSIVEEFGQYLILRKSVFNPDTELWPKAIINLRLH